MDKKQATVLIVDDTTENIELLSDMLSGSFNIRAAQSGREALEIMRSGTDEIDVVLLDVIMPGLDGCGVLEQMKADPALRALPVVVITSDDNPKTKDRAFELGAVDFVPRGTDMNALNHRINTVLRLWELDKIRAEHERVKSELQTEKHLCALMDNIPGGVAVLDTDGETVSCSFFNDGMLSLFGISAEELFSELSSDNKPEWLTRFIKNADREEHFSFEFKNGSDSTDAPENGRWIRLIAGKLGEHDGKSEIYCVFLDVTAEKQREFQAEQSKRKLRAKENQFETLLDNSPGGIAYAEHTSDGKVSTLFASQGLADMLCYPDRDSCIAELCINPYVGISEETVLTIRMKMSEALAGCRCFKHSFKCATKDGGELWLMMRLHLVKIDGESNSLGMYAFITNITKEKKIEDELRLAAYFDPLTGLYNRRAFLKNAQRILDENPGKEFSVMKLNIANFKVINDILGRDVGDKILIIIADVLRGLIGNDGVYARFFADNYMIMIPYSERSVHPHLILDSVQRAIMESGEISHDIQMYIGVYKTADRTLSAENMVDRAAIACRSINGSFREHIAYYDEKMRRSMLEQQEITDESRRALENGEFYVCYQPIYGVRARKFVSAEALVRWNHPTKGIIQPTKFIPIFEKNGFIAELDLFVLEQVCIYQKKRRDSGLPPFPISVNVSRMSLYNPNLFSIINDLTNKYQVDPEYFRIEITESAYNDNPQQLLDTVGRLREKCYPVLMDDFGSGYSSLNTLKDIPIDILKLDMKFMQGFEKNGKVGTIVTAISRMSKWLNVPLLAEGVETKEQYDFLVSIGCSYIQGFYFSRPVPERDFTDLTMMEEVTAVNEPLETFGMGQNINELLGSNAVVSKFIDSVFGGLGIYEMVDGRLELIRVNDGYMQIMGYTTDDLNSGNMDIWTKLHPDDVEISRNACLEAMRTDKAVRATVRRYNRDGEILYLDGIHRWLGGSKEHPIFCIAFNNLNEKIRSDKIIENARERTEEILTDTGSIAWEVDLETKDLFFVGNWDYGEKPDSFDNYMKDISPFSKIVHPDDAVKADVFHNDYTPGKKSMELRLKNKNNGEYCWWRITRLIHFDGSGKPIRLTGVGTNINSEKKTRQMLDSANSRINLTMNNINLGILFLEMNSDGDPHILFSNDMFWETIGKKKTDDAHFFDTVHQGVDKNALRNIIESAKNGDAHLEYQTTRDDGEEIWIDFTLAPSHYEGSERAYMIMVSDITERHENKSCMDALIRSFNGGIALISSADDQIKVEVANNKFFEVLGVRRENTQRIAHIISAVFSTNSNTADLRIRHDSEIRIVRIHIDKAVVSPRSRQRRYVITAIDVTFQRAEAKNRIAERMAYAEIGTYDEVFEINLRNQTMKMVYSKRMRNIEQTAFSMSAVLKEWSDKYVHPNDISDVLDLFTAPLNNPDFTDLYHEVRFRGISGSRDYHYFGITVVRSKSDTCMLFMRDKTHSLEINRNELSGDANHIYKLASEQTHTTVIEYDYETKRVTCSPSIKDFAAHAISEDGTCENDDFLSASMIYPDDREKFIEFLKALKNSSGSNTLNARMEMADGSYKWCRIVVSLIKNGLGQTIESLCTINQIHEEMLARQKAKKSEDLLRRTVRNIPVGVGIFRLDGENPVPVYLSDNIYTIYGLETDSLDIPALPIDRLVHENKLCAGTEGEYALESYRADGSKFWLGVNYRVIDEQGSLMLYASLSDISERVASLRHETAEEQMYNVLLSESGTILFDYRAEQDSLTYFSLDNSGTRHTDVVEDLLEDPEKFTLLSEMDRVNFIAMLNRLLKDPGTSELPVRITVDGYPRRHKIFMKSVCDSDKKVFEIVGKIEDIEDELARLEKIQTKAMYDSLCFNIYNKATTEELIRGELDRSTGGALLMIDIDDFKSINDNLGHLFGDEFLKKFASTVKGVFRDTDIVGRYGGDEFFVFMPHVSAALAEKKGQLILDSVTKIEVPLPGGVKSSVGIAVVNPDNRNYPQLLKQADSALYNAKNGGKNQVVVFDSSTMKEGSYRTADSAKRGTSTVALSSNPNTAASTFMRVFSALYSSPDLNDGINQILELIGREYDVSRVYIFEDTPDGKYCSNTFEWCAEGIQSEKDSLQMVSYEDDLDGSYRSNMNDDGIFYCHDVAELEDPGQREILMRQGIKSVLQCLITDAGKIKGFVGFDECRSNRFWTQEQIDSLAFLSHVISIFLMKERSKKN